MKKGYLNGVWIASVNNIDFPSKRGLSAAELRRELDDIVATVKKARLNAVFFQARPACDALYASKLFPVSEYLTGRQGAPLPDGFDPLRYVTELCHAEGIELHAWLNPYRVSSGSAENPRQDLSALCEGHPARLHPDWVVAYPDGKLYFNPAIAEVRDCIAAGVGEIVENYAVDGIHFDDYFYPYPLRDKETGAVLEYDDRKQYAESGTSLSLGDWRRENVNKLVRQCYETIHSIRSDCSFGISPFGIWRNKSESCPQGMETRGLECYSALYADCTAWVEGGYIDYICPQIYWKFDTAVAPFGVILDWYDEYMRGKKPLLYVGHGLYRCEDEGWERDEIPKQLDYCRTKATCRGSVCYGYGKFKKNALSICEEFAKRAK